MASGHMLRRRIDVTGLVVKEKVGFELAQKFALGKPAQKHGFIDFNVPVHQGTYGPLMRWRAARCDQRGAYSHVRCTHLLQAVQRF